MNRFCVNTALFMMLLSLFGTTLLVLSVLCFPPNRNLDMEIYMRMFICSLCFVIGPSISAIALFQAANLLKNETKQPVNSDLT